MTPEYVTFNKRIPLKELWAIEFESDVIFTSAPIQYIENIAFFSEVKHRAMKMFLAKPGCHCICRGERENYNHLPATSGQNVPILNYAEMESKMDLN